MSNILTPEQFKRALDFGEWAIVSTHDAALRAQLAACEKELPDTWYVDKPLGERLAMLIIQWQKALRINTELEQQLAVVTKEREHFYNGLKSLMWAIIDAGGSVLQPADVIHQANSIRQLGNDLVAAQADLAQATKLREHWEALADEYMTRIQRLESRTARLKEALEKLLTQVLGEGMDMTAAIEQAQQALAEEK